MKPLAPTLPRAANMQKANSCGPAAPPVACARTAAIAVPVRHPPSRSGSKTQEELDDAHSSNGSPQEPLHAAAAHTGRTSTQHQLDTQDAEALLKPLTLAASELPEQAQRYLQLLAESSTSNGSMQRHLVHLMARAAADTQKLSEIVFNPLEGVADVVADQSSQMFVQHMQRQGRTSDDGTGSSTPASTPQAMTAVQCKMLSMLLSVLMTGLVSNAAEATQLTHLTNHTAQATSTELSHTLKSTPPTSDASFFRLDSFRGKQGASFMVRAAPSVSAGVSASGASALLGAGGMATSTALKMLRADSKLRDPDLGNFLGHILDTVSESTESGDYDQKMPNLPGHNTLKHASVPSGAGTGASLANASRNTTA